MNLKKLAVAAGAITLLAGTGSAAADGGNHAGRWRNVHVQFEPNVAPDTGTSELLCGPPDTVDPTIKKCVQASTVTATQTGDIQGTTVQAGSVGANGVDAHHLPQSAIGTFDGTVKGCGDDQGGFLYVGTGTLDFTTLVATMTYTIVEGSGTGQLAGITGRFQQSGAGPQPISGTVRCRAPR